MTTGAMTIEAPPLLEHLWNLQDADIVHIANEAPPLLEHLWNLQDEDIVHIEAAIRLLSNQHTPIPELH